MSLLSVVLSPAAAALIISTPVLAQQALPFTQAATVAAT